MSNHVVCKDYMFLVGLGAPTDTRVLPPTKSVLPRTIPPTVEWMISELEQMMGWSQVHGQYSSTMMMDNEGNYVMYSDIQYLIDRAKYDLAKSKGEPPPVPTAEGYPTPAFYA